MCGISGLIGKDIIDKNSFYNISTTHLKKRGPDNQTIYEDPKHNLLLYHARLSIIDLDKRSNQPNSFGDERYIITYNGEIYNFLKLKKILQRNNIKITTSSDTEIVLKYIKLFGIKKSLIDFDGMFAFAIYDKINKILYLARDRLGQKPLYFYHNKINNFLIFSSDIKVIKDVVKDKLRISNKNLNIFLSLSYFPKNITIYDEVKKLNAGNYLRYSNIENTVIEHTYWKPNYNNNFIEKNEKKIIDKCENILLESLEQTLISDVPLSFYLSSGIDSSLLCALTKKCLNRDVKAYTLVNEDMYHDESVDVKKISKHLKLNTNYIKINPSLLKENIKKNVDIYTEPFADSSQIAITYLNSMVKEKVIISGDGGDELFGGYNRHQWLNKIIIMKKKYPKFLFKLLFYIISVAGQKNIDNFFFQKIFNNYFIYEKSKKFLKACIADSELQSYLSVVSKNHNYLTYDKKLELFYSEIWKKNLNIFEKITLSDLENYLTDDILVKVDRSCMFYSIENRSPYLNNRVLEFSQNLDQKYKIRKNTQKWILKKLLERYLPSELIYKPKRGFKIPMGDWMIKDLRNFFEKNLLNIKEQNFCQYKNINKYWKDHIKYKNNNEDLLWNYFLYSIWLKKYT